MLFRGVRIWAWVVGWDKMGWDGWMELTSTLSSGWGLESGINAISCPFLMGLVVLL